jgi:hypothetical protein
MAELIVDGHSSSVDLAPFDPARFAPKAATRGPKKRRGERGRKQGEVPVGEQW